MDIWSKHQTEFLGDSLSFWKHTYHRIKNAKKYALMFIRYEEKILMEVLYFLGWPIKSRIGGLLIVLYFKKSSSTSNKIRAHILQDALSAFFVLKLDTLNQRSV